MPDVSEDVMSLSIAFVLHLHQSYGGRHFEWSQESEFIEVYNLGRSHCWSGVRTGQKNRGVRFKDFTYSKVWLHTSLNHNFGLYQSVGIMLD